MLRRSLEHERVRALGQPPALVNRTSTLTSQYRRKVHEHLGQHDRVRAHTRVLGAAEFARDVDGAAVGRRRDARLLLVRDACPTGRRIRI